MPNEIQRLVVQAHVAVQELQDVLDANAPDKVIEDAVQFAIGILKAISILNDRPRLGSLGKGL